MKYLKTYENAFAINNQPPTEGTDWNKILHSATWTQTKLGEDVWYMDFDKIKLAIENGADPNCCGTLKWATSMNNFQVVKYMLEHGADVDDTYDDSGKWTPLMLAADDGYVEIAKLLIDHDADPYHPNFQGYTTMDVVTPKKETSNAVFGYESQTKAMKKKRDEIRKYIERSVHVVAKKYNL